LTFNYHSVVVVAYVCELRCSFVLLDTTAATATTTTTTTTTTSI